MRPTTDATPTTCTPIPRTWRPARTGALLSVGVGAAAVAALLAPAAAGQPGEITATYAAEATPAIAPTVLTVADRQAATERAASRSSRSGERGSQAAAADAESADETIPETLAAPELEKAGTRYTTTDLNVRLAPEEDAEVEKVLKPGAKVTITDVSQDGFQQVIVKDQPRWVKGEYLSKSKPEPKPAGPSSAPCASGSGVESGLRSNTVAVHRAVCNAFPSVSSYGGIRGGGGNHGTGRALDIMVTGSTGDAIAKYVQAHAAQLGVTEVIWEQKIWTTQRAGDGWRWMSDRGSATANHYDHVHVSTR
jgi:uncharacterized protein YgiM (DUF1202 family)